jgi:hypothetical protein
LASLLHPHRRKLDRTRRYLHCRSYTQNAGPWTGTVIDRLDSDNPEITQYGPSRGDLANGSTFSNPLATVYRIVGSDRGERQIQAPAIKNLGLKVSKIFSLGGTREFEVGANIFNLFNWGDFHQYTYSSANRIFSPNFAQMRSLQAPRGLQLLFRFRY